MTKNQKRYLAAIAIIFIAFSVIVFAAPLKMNGIFWISYVFSIIAMAIQIYVFKIAFGGGKSVRSKFYGFPIARIGIAYLVIQIFLSVIFMVLAAIVPLWLVIILYVVALAAAVLGLISTNAIRDEIERQDVKLQADTGCMQMLRSQIDSLPEQCEDKEAVKALVNLADEFRYSDPVSGEALEDIENNLMALMSELQKAVIDNDAEGVKGLCKRTSAALTERNRLCKLNK